jgi:enamine deaminase RidA (YjgF/YER057c/UK114 family)
MSEALKNIEAHGHKLPVLKPAQTLYRPYIKSGNQVFISGQLPLGFGELTEHKGQLGRDYTIEQGQKTAHICGLNVIAQLQEACGGDLDKVKSCLKLTVFVNSSPSFTDHPQIANPVSDLMVKTFGDKGQHARSAVGVAQLPFGVAVEVEAIFEVE